MEANSIVTESPIRVHLIKSLPRSSFHPISLMRMRAQGARVLKNVLNPVIKLETKRAIEFEPKPKPSKPKVGQSESTKPSKEAKPLAENLDGN
jgi:hypothetical protein